MEQVCRAVKNANAHRTLRASFVTLFLPIHKCSRVPWAGTAAFYVKSHARAVLASDRNGERGRSGAVFKAQAET